MTTSFLSHSVQETRSFGAQVATTAKPGDVFALEGELGSGKTEFARGFVSALCGPSAVRSPTFSIINIHETPEFPIYHFDFYRLKKKEELVEIGYYDFVRSNGISLIEWADMFAEVLPENAKHVRFTDKRNNTREIVIV
jgi:tRNA threonylcarbamoyladenosine biosynthesis protein TsaE